MKFLPVMATVKKNNLLLRFDRRRATDQLKKLRTQLKELKTIHESKGRAMLTRKEAIARKYNTNQQILERLKYLKANGAVDENSVLQQEDSTPKINRRILELEEEILQSKRI